MSVKPRGAASGRQNSVSAASGAAASTTAKVAKKDIWALISEHNKQGAKTGGGERPDSNVLFVGSRRGGKSTLIARFLSPDKEEEPKPTIGVEYTFARRSAVANIDKKDVAHIWEAAGGADLGEQLVQNEHLFLPGTALTTSMVVIVLDLSKPWEILTTLNFWLRKIRERVESHYERLGRRGSKLPEQLLNRAKKQFGLNHEDRDSVHFTGIPIVLVATKYDLFKDVDTEVRKVVARTLRFMAHTNGAFLLYTGGLGSTGGMGSADGSEKQQQQRARETAESKSMLTAFRGTLNHLIFHNAPAKGVERDHTRPLLIPVGCDRLQDIGRPKGSAVNATPEAVAADWQALFESTVPGPAPSLLRGGNDAATTTSATQQGGPPDLDKYAEPEIDAVKAQRDAELASIRRQKQAAPSQISSSNVQSSSSSQPSFALSSTAADMRQTRPRARSSRTLSTSSQPTGPGTNT